jgi:hypothetical protein
MVGQMVVVTWPHSCFRNRGQLCWVATNADLSSVEVYVSEPSRIPFHQQFPMSQFGVEYQINLCGVQKTVKEQYPDL